MIKIALLSLVAAAVMLWAWKWTHIQDVTSGHQCHVTRDLNAPSHRYPFKGEHYDPFTGKTLRDWVHPQSVEAGHPACDPKQPHRPPCEMGSCAQIGPDGKPNGHKCSSYCAKGCCGCGTACTVDYPGEGQNPDEETK